MKTSRFIPFFALLIGLSFSLPARAQESRIELHTHFSSILSMQKNFNVFLPEGYDQESDRYPVIYLFRGHEREWANPYEDGSRVGNIKTVADRLYSQGAIGKMIFIMPGLTGLPPVPAEEFSYVLDELIPYVDAHFRTRPVRQQRGIDGFSMGGYDALHLLWRSPETFITLGTYDGSFWAFDLGLYANAPDSYWARVYPMKFLIHSAYGTSPAIQQFVDILTAHGIQNAFDTLALTSQAIHNWYFADLHMERSLPLHWEQFSHGSGNLALSLLSPLPSTKVSGEIPVTWSLGPHPDSLQTFLKYSCDRGNSWHELYVSNSADTTFLWNTATVPDGTQYLLMVQVVGDSVYGFVESSGRFTIDNPGNGTPEITLLSPNDNEQLSGMYELTWWAEDADGDPLQISLDASANDGITWEHLSDEANTGSYLWDTREGANSTSYRVRIRCDDGQAVAEDLSKMFAVHNIRPILQDTLVRHIAGGADGKITVHAVDPAQATGHTYRVFFHDSIPGSKAYSVFDADRSTTVVAPTPVLAADREGPLFDGLRLVLDDYDPPRISQDSTRWIIGTSDLVPQVMLPQFDPGTGLITGTPYISDYHITLYDHVVDTSAARFGLPAVPIHFTVWNATEDHKVKVLFAEFDNNQTISRLDDLILLEEDSVGQPLVTWELFFSGPEGVTPPVPGDVFLLKILKPFTSMDVYEFVALQSGIVSVAASESPSEFRLEQNYPNPFNSNSEITYQVSDIRYVRLVVYDVLGREVTTLVDGPHTPGSYSVRFDATNLASGIYFYRITAGSFISTRKMLLLK
jgi:hypothetical protein